MLGVAVNALAIIAGSIAGALFKKGIPERLTKHIMSGIALCVIYIGISGALKGENTLVLVISTALGGIIGELIDIDRHLSSLGERIGRRFKNGDGASVGEGFVTGTLVFCVGAMAIVGSLQSGLTGNHETLFTKALLDGISSLVFAATMGFGVALSGVSIFIYQGVIVLLAGLLSPLLSDYIIAEMTCAGSLLIIGLGLNMLGITKIKVANFLPAIFLPIALCQFM